jgi:DNA end-binding protein Ku
MSYMAARSIGTGTITFGLVTIPVKLYPATESKAQLSFNMLHKACGTRVRQQYVCPKDNEVVGRDEIVKGYEFAPGQFVTFTPQELKALEERATQSIDITEFVPQEAVEPVYYDKPYYLAPDKGGDKAFHLLAEVMRESRRAAIARYAVRGKQHIVMVRPSGSGLVLQQLLYADEVRSIKEVPTGDAPTLRDAELKLAAQLVDQISSETFDPSQYEDEVKKRVQADIQKKIEGQEIEISETPEAPAQIIDLMEALKASLSASGRGGRGERASPEARRPAKAAPSRASAKASKEGAASGRTSARKSRGGKR